MAAGSGALIIISVCHRENNETVIFTIINCRYGTDYQDSSGQDIDLEERLWNHLVLSGDVKHYLIQFGQ